MRSVVLVVDDVKINREILCEILENDYVVITAKDGEEALARLEERKSEIAVILLDLVMPKVDGFAVLEHLAEEELLQTIPVLIISAVNSVETEQKCFHYGVSDFIKEPFDNYVVRKRVENTISLFRSKEALEQTIILQADALTRQSKQLRAMEELLLDQEERLRMAQKGIMELQEIVEECGGKLIHPKVALQKLLDNLQESK